MGCNAIGTVNRGVSKEIATPFHEQADSCIGCGSCAAICPTGHIQMEDTPATRKIWDRTFELVQCDSCKAPIMTQEYLDYAVANKELPADYYTTCAACKKKSLAAKFDKVGS